MTDLEKAAMEGYGRFFTKIYFVLPLGYFKAKQLFFVIEMEPVHENADHIQQRYFPQHILDQADLPILKQPVKQLLNSLKVRLEEKFKKVNDLRPTYAFVS